MEASTSSELSRAEDQMGRALREDLLTDWVPDALGAARVDVQADWVEQSNRSALTVATASGSRAVPILPIEFRLWATRNVARDDVAAAERSLSPNVFGYKDALTPYRTDWRRFVEARHRLHARFPHALRVDIRNFFGDVGPDALATLPPSAIETAEVSRALSGEYLVPGHRWARRLGNLVLARIDERIEGQFIRWQDDFWLFGMSRYECEAAANCLSGSAAEIGLRVQPSKVLHLGPDARSRDYRAVGSFPLRSMLAAARDERDVSLAKLILRRSAEERDVSIAEEMASLLSAFPVLAPRVAMYLASVLGQGSTEPEAALCEALNADHGDWVKSRLLAAALTHPSGLRAVPSSVVDSLAASPIPSLRALSARVQVLTNKAPVSAGPRFDDLLRNSHESWLWQHRPIVRTTL